MEASWVPDFLGIMAQRPRLFCVTARASRVSNAPGSKSGRKMAPGCDARRVLVLFPLAEPLSRICAASGAAVRLTAELLTVALSWTWRSWLPGESCSVLEKL